MRELIVAPELELRLPGISHRVAAQMSQSRPGSDPELKPSHLPRFELGSLPNHINRSSLFAPIAKGSRVLHHRVRLVSRGDCTLEYSGEQLDEADGDILMALVHSARSAALGAAIPITRADLLRRIGRCTGKGDYEWLHRRMRSLAEAALYIEARKPDGSNRYRVGFSSAFHIVSEFDLDEKSGLYQFRLDPRWVHLFSNSEYARIDWGKRMNIRRGQDMAKALQRLLATSSNCPQYHSTSFLRGMLMYQGRERDFLKALERSLRELVHVEVLVRWEIGLSTRKNQQVTAWIHRDSVAAGSG